MSSTHGSEVAEGASPMLSTPYCSPQGTASISVGRHVLISETPEDGSVR